MVQKKTGKELWCPIFPALWRRRWRVGRNGPARSASTNPKASLFGSCKQLSEAWNYEREHNPVLKPLADLVLHGLRGHACVRGSIAPATTQSRSPTWWACPEPMVRAGHTRLSVQKENAVAAIFQLDPSLKEQSRIRGSWKLLKCLVSSFCG